MKVEVQKDAVHYMASGFPADAVYNQLKVKLGEDLPLFARFQVGAGAFVWSFDGDGWQKLSESHPIEQSDIYAFIEAKKTIVAEKLKGTRVNVDFLFTRPSDDFVFYKYDGGGQPVVVIAGWGFKFPVRATGGFGSERFAVKPEQDVLVSFIEAGAPVSHKVFSLKTASGRVKQATTDANGLFSLPRLYVGDTYLLSCDGRDQSFVVEKNMPDVVMDLTRPLHLTTVLSRDGNPVVSAPVSVVLNGSRHESVTGIDGRCEFSLDYTPNRICLISAGEEQREIHLNYPDTEVCFESVTPMCGVCVTVRKNGVPAKYETVLVQTDHGSESLVTDERGKAFYKFPFTAASPIVAKVRDMCQTRYADTSGVDFLFEITERILKSVCVKVVGEDGSIKTSYPVRIESRDKDFSAATDDAGIYVINECCVGEMVTVRDLNNLNNFISEVIADDGNVLVLTVSASVQRPCKITFLDTANLPLNCDEVYMKQDDKSMTLRPDAHGTASFQKGIFIPGSPIETSLVVDGVNRGPFGFEVTEDEDEYQVVFDLKQRRPWWKVLLMLLLLTAMIAGTFVALWLVLI